MAIPFLTEFFTGALGFRLGSATGPRILSGAGSPEGAVTAPIGSMYSRTDGGTNTATYRKETGAGNTGWVANAAGGGSTVYGPHAQYPIGINEFAHFAVNGTALTTIAAVANRLDFMPFIPEQTLTYNQLSVEVSTAVAASQARLAIYSADASGFPGARLVDGATVLDCATTGDKVTAITATVLTAGTIYWVAILSSSTQTYRGVALAGLMPFAGDATANAMHTLRRVTQTFASGMPATAPASTRTASIAPFIRLRRSA